MPDYRRIRVPGGTYFFTGNLFERKNDLLTHHIDVLREAVKQSRRSRPFHMDYVHINPIQHGYVEKVWDWPYSTFHRYVELGGYPKDWASDPELEFDTGEPMSE